MKHADVPLQHRNPSQKKRRILRTMMRAMAIDKLGGPEVLTLHKLPVPVPGADEVLIELDTSGVGSWDAWMRENGADAGPTHFPFVLGTDGAGIVAAVGTHVHRFAEGDAVYAYSYETCGFYAEYVAVAAHKAAPIPKGLDLHHAGAMACTGLTALQGIDDKLHVMPGESVIIHGATGGVGTLAVQFAKLRGARVLATASGKDGIALVRRLGADAAVDGKKEDITEAARRFAPDGINAVLALVGGDSLERCVDAMHRDGRLAYPNGVEPEPRKRSGITIISYDGVPGERQFEHLNRAADEAHLQVPIAADFLLEAAPEAHRRLEQGHVLGKIVLHIWSGPNA
jgi:NADPH2:quinone reductase